VIGHITHVVGEPYNKTFVRALVVEGAASPMVADDVPVQAIDPRPRYYRGLTLTARSAT
jgi:hypothetical protein